MPRYIDADKANVEEISCYYGSNCYIEDVQEWLNEQPTADVVEVVRCKDCTEFMAESSICSDTGYEVGDDDFCSFGERRNDG